MKYKGIVLAISLACSPVFQLFAKEEKNCRRIVIAINLEDVLISKSWLGMFAGTMRGLYKAKNKKELAKLLFSYSFLRDFYKAVTKQLYAGDTRLEYKSDYVSYFAHTYPALSTHESEIFDALHQYTLNEELFALFLWLKISKNYTLYVATNKNKASYTRIKTKLNDALQKKFGICWDDLFDGAFYVDKIDHTSNEQFTFYAKPDTRYFLGLWNYLSQRAYEKDSTQVIYIDDNEHNIVSARATHHEYKIPLESLYYKNSEQIKIAIDVLTQSLAKDCLE